MVIRMNREQFIVEVEKLGVQVTIEKMEKLDLFYKLLLEWNEKINLTSIVNIEEVFLKHFYDSLTLVKICDLGLDLSICDVGSGAGFPGIVIKIFFPNLNITLIDSLNKRVLYLNSVINELGLVNIRAIHTRMEDYSRINQEKYDIITARAVASISILSEISINSLKVGGKLVFMKGIADKELEDSNNALKKLSIGVEKIEKFVLPFENSNRMLISLVKLDKTNKIYPRNIDKIRKNPL